MRETCTSGSTRGRRAADLIRYSSSYSTVNPVEWAHWCGLAERGPAAAFRPGVPVVGESGGIGGGRRNKA